MRLSHVAIKTNDIDKSLDFYCGKLGLTEAYRLYHDNGELWIIYLRAGDGLFVELFTGGDGTRYQKNQCMQHLCFVVDDLETVVKGLQEKGVVAYKGPTYLGKPHDVPYVLGPMGKCGSKAVYVADPDGNEIEIMMYTELSLQTKTDEELKELEPLIKANEYILEAKGQTGK